MSFVRSLRRRKQKHSENNIAMCFLLEIPLRGFPIQIRFYDTCRIPKSNTHLLCFNGFHLKRKCPQGDLKQEACRKHPVLLQDAKSERERLAMECLDSLLEWMRRA